MEAKRKAERILTEMESIFDEIIDVKEKYGKVHENLMADMHANIEKFIDLNRNEIFQSVQDVDEIESVIEKYRLMTTVSAYAGIMQEIKKYAEFISVNEDEMIISKKNLINVINPVEREDLLEDQIYMDLFNILEMFPFADYYLFKKDTQWK